MNPSDRVLEMPTSTGQRRKMRRIGTLGFTLKGQPLTLTAFVEAAENDLSRLFVPFGDLTNGTETYQGGRYLDLDRTATGVYDLDFNRAYHPFCCSTRPTTARFRRARTGCRCRSAPASGWRRAASDAVLGRRTAPPKRPFSGHAPADP